VRVDAGFCLHRVVRTVIVRTVFMRPVFVRRVLVSRVLVSSVLVSSVVMALIGHLRVLRPQATRTSYPLVGTPR